MVIFNTKNMETTYNFIINDLLLNSEDKKFIEGFSNEFVDKGIILEVEYLTEQSFTREPYTKLKNLLDQTMESCKLKLKCVKDQDFEGASSFREEERKFIIQIERVGFNFYNLKQNEFALYHVDVDKKKRKLKFVIYTNSEEFIAFIGEIKGKVSKDSNTKQEPLNPTKHF